MTALGVPFRAIASTHVEIEAGETDPASAVLANARGKAREVAARAGIPDGGAVIGADTEVVLDGRTLGKPRSAGEAGEMLRALSGRAHEVLTGLCLITSAMELTDCDRTRVFVRRLPPAALAWYLATGEWRDRAGGYAIQGAGAAIVERIEGDHTTVVGLPLSRLIGLMTAAGVGPWVGDPGASGAESRLSEGL
jgi:septum formation protein